MARYDPAALVASHLTLIAPIARRIRRGLPPCFDLADLEQTGAIGLIAAANEFDASRGVPFAAYARMRIRGAILDAVRADYRESTNTPIPAATAVEAGQEAAAMREEAVRALLDALNALSARQRRVLLLRFGLGMTQAETGRALGIGRRGAGDLESRAVAALRVLI